ncbi:hypothetical protein DPMN_002442 [Dreissena polymorpha]|uniref:Uncharacterized protein n=1 Tax=Dreissena polymorpha TaxID=45954 RepID=A0A9D4MN49_DREPO|nr:hypothetical protein DPMN_002442 [Dreissena polymorpha]
MTVHRYIDHDLQMTVTMSKVKVTVTRAAKKFIDDNSSTLKPGIRKAHMDVSHDRQMTPFDFQFTSSKFEVTVTQNSKMVS